MNQHRFRLNVLLVIGFFGLAIVSGVVLDELASTNRIPPLYETFKDMIPLLIAIPAAWLGYCFQRRQAYLKDVRGLWSGLVSAVQDAIQYTHLRSPNQAEYGRVLKNLSIVTEEFRAVFANLGEAQGRVGLYPFESVKTIHDCVAALGFDDTFKSEEAEKVRREIVVLWKKLRGPFLLELERNIPAQVDSPYLE